MATLDKAIAHLKEQSGLIVIDSTTWSDADFRSYEEATGLRIPTQLEEVLRRVGHCVVEENDAFLVQCEDGSRAPHESQILVSEHEQFITMHRMFISQSPWVEQFTLPMVFFGTADAGHSYLLMDGKNRDNGAVYFWERATDPFGTGNNAKGVVKVADSLPEFFFSLTSAENL
ncbi:SMI1/KNR4 family protein [Rhizobium helianthi]|uniref:SMI1/KNR4 family protein n=1 Tax=Rhizobium helianthi TaxID=1132695 RepID=A0ABW4M9X5_9HYPH